MSPPLTHLDESTETSPSLGPSFSAITECGHLHKRKKRVSKNGGETICDDVLPRIDESRFVHRTPAVVSHVRDIGCALIELAAVLHGQTFECLSVTSAVREHIEKRDDGGYAGFSDGFEEVVGKGRASMGGCDGGYGQNAKLAVGKVCSEVPTVEAALFGSQLAYTVCSNYCNR